MIQAALVAALVAIGVATLLTPIARKVAPLLGAVDAPGGRRVHAAVTPRMGGTAVIAAYLVAIGATSLAGLFPWGLHPQTVRVVPAFLAGGLFIGLVGAVDDIRNLGARRKLVAQVVAASIAWAGGARIESLRIPGLGHFIFSWPLGYLLSIAWVVAFINAINLIDGLDGLAGGTVFFATLTNTVIAFMSGNVLAAVLNAALGGAVLGFLFYNFNPATIFLGDTGSMFLGYCVGAAALLTSRQKESTVVSFLVPILAMGLPLADTLVTMLRRFLARRPIFSADRGHIHHRLLDLGLTHRRAVLLLYGLSVLLCFAAVAAAFGQNWQVGVALVGAILSLVGVGRFAGYFEATLRKRAQRASLLSPPTDALRRALPRFVHDAGAAPTPAAAWAALEGTLEAGHFAFAEHLPPGEAVAAWRWEPRENQARREGKLVTVDFPLRLFPGAADSTLRFGCLTDEDDVPPQVEILLQLAADVLESSLRRLHVERPSRLLRAVGESVATPLPTRASRPTMPTPLPLEHAEGRDALGARPGAPRASPARRPPRATLRANGAVVKGPTPPRRRPRRARRAPPRASSRSRRDRPRRGPGRPPASPLEHGERGEAQRRLGQLSAVFEHLVDGTVGLRRLFDERAEPPAVVRDLPHCAAQFRRGDSPPRLGPAHHPAGAVRARGEGERVAEAAHEVRGRAHRTGHDHVGAGGRGHGPLAVHEQAAPAVLFDADVVVVHVEQRRGLGLGAQHLGRHLGRALEQAPPVLARVRERPAEVGEVGRPGPGARRERRELAAARRLGGPAVVRAHRGTEAPRARVREQPKPPRAVAIEFEKVVSAAERAEVPGPERVAHAPERSGRERRRGERLGQRHAPPGLTRVADGHRRRERAQPALAIAPRRRRRRAGPEAQRRDAAPEVAPERRGHDLGLGREHRAHGHAAGDVRVGHGRDAFDHVRLGRQAAQLAERRRRQRPRPGEHRHALRALGRVKEGRHGAPGPSSPASCGRTTTRNEGTRLRSSDSAMCARKVRARPDDGPSAAAAPGSACPGGSTTATCARRRSDESVTATTSAPANNESSTSLRSSHESSSAKSRSRRSERTPGGAASPRVRARRPPRPEP
jgi:UDP-GlcNAc:undecaprenyl-phosphate GlcNAc-1-phosphate transferase